MPVLLSRVLGQMTTDLEAAAGVGPAVPSLAVWSNVVRCVAEAGSDGIDEKGLAHAARISRRLATAAVKGAARRGWITAQLELTESGEAAASVWPAELTGLDADPAYTALRAVLIDVVGRLPFELPHFPASYGAADPSAVGGPFVPPSKKADGVPTHGKDWRPVLRADEDTVTSLPLTALLSQTLMAFTIDYENRFPWPLASTATVLCHISAEPRPLADVPGEHGITGNGKSLLERHLIAVVTRDEADGAKVVALTDRGRAVMQHHPTRLETVEADWRGRYGDDSITALRDALGPLASGARDQPDHVMAPLHVG
ncbi:MAG: hypothetical protein QOG87_144 [Actinomycetota bacterium]